MYRIARFDPRVKGPAVFRAAELSRAAADCLAISASVKAAEDGYQLLERDGHKVKWGERRLGIGARISYAFARATLHMDDRRAWLADARNCGHLAPAEALAGEHLSMATLARETAAAFRVWERAANLSFHEVTDSRDADIVIGAQGEPRRRAFAKGMRVFTMFATH